MGSSPASNTRAIMRAPSACRTFDFMVSSWSSSGAPSCSASDAGLALEHLPHHPQPAAGATQHTGAQAARDEPVAVVTPVTHVGVRSNVTHACDQRRARSRRASGPNRSQPRERGCRGIVVSPFLGATLHSLVRRGFEKSKLCAETSILLNSREDMRPGLDEGGEAPTRCRPPASLTRDGPGQAPTTWPRTSSLHWMLALSLGIRATGGSGLRSCTTTRSRRSTEPPTMWKSSPRTHRAPCFSTVHPCLGLRGVRRRPGLRRLRGGSRAGARGPGSPRGGLGAPPDPGSHGNAGRREAREGEAGR
jgi:hypothetical protein